MFDPYRKWLGIPPAEQPPNHYRLLGVSLYESDLDVIKTAVVQRSAYVRNFQAGKQGDDAARILNEIAAAEAVLTNAGKRAAYDAELKRKEAAKRPRPAAARPAAPKVDPLLEQAAAMTTLSAPWQSPAFAPGRTKQTNYLPLAIGGVAVVVVVILGMVLGGMLGGEDEPVAQGGSQPADAGAPQDQPADAPAASATTDNSGTTETASPAPSTVSAPPAESTSPGTAETVSAETPAETESVEPTEVDLLALIDPARDSVKGAWRMEGGALVSTGNHADRLQIPYKLPDEYVLEIDAVPQRGSEGFQLGIVVGGRQTCVLLGTFGGAVNGLGLLDGRNGNENETLNGTRVFAAGVTSRFVVEVRRGGVRVTANGNQVIDWQGDARRLSVHEHWVVPDKTLLFLGDGEEVMRYTRFVLKPIDGAAVPPTTAVANAPASSEPTAPAEPILVEDFSLAAAQLADLANWTPRGGEWSVEGGRIIGRGDGLLEFKQHFPQDFLLELTVTVRSGTRMRIHLGGSDLYLGSEGAGNMLWLHGTALTGLQGQPVAYQPDRPLKLAVKLRGPQLTFTVGGRSVATAQRTKIGPVQLTLQPGDGFSPGDVAFGEFRLGPPPLSADEAKAAILAAGGSIEPYRFQGRPALKIVMQGPGFGDALVENVHWLPDTRELFLGGSAVSDAGLKHLIGLDRLEVLGLDDTRLTDAGMAHLAQVPSLKIINVGWSSGRAAITDVGAEHLSKLTELTSLGISHTQLTDEGLKHLAKLKKLDTLFLNGITLSAAAIAELKRKLPKANIVR